MPDRQHGNVGFEMVVAELYIAGLIGEANGIATK
jgi:hypothetical protein